MSEEFDTTSAPWREPAMTAPSVRERLSDLLYDRLTEGGALTTREECGGHLDAILAELAEPTKETVKSVYDQTMGAEWKYFAEMWKAGIQHIRSGGA